MRTMTRRMALAAAAVGVAALLAACGKAAGASSGGGCSNLTIGSRSIAGLGTVLVDPNGMTLYVLKGETSSKITCTGSCATAWPPLLLPSGDSGAVGGSGVSGTFGTVERPGGGTQVTFNGMPLYTWTGDRAPGDATGQNVSNFVVVPALGGGSGSSPSQSGGGGYGPGGY